MSFLTPHSLYFIMLSFRCRKEKKIFYTKKKYGDVCVPKPDSRNELQTSINSLVVLVWSLIESVRGGLDFVK